MGEDDLTPIILNGVGGKGEWMLKEFDVIGERPRRGIIKGISSVEYILYRHCSSV